MRAQSLFKVTWTKSAPGQTYTDDGIIADYRTMAADWSKPGIEMVKKGDADAALKGAAKVVTAEYFSEHVSHVCMEPMNATVHIDGDKVEVWAGNQAPGVMQIMASIAAGTKPDKVSVHTPCAGRRLRPAFGRRRCVPRHACWPRRSPGRPVKMIWTRGG